MSGYIKRDFIDRLLDKVHIEEVIGDYVKLKQAGANFKGKSPFTEERTGSFMVSVAKNIWKDFSSGKGGTVVNFLMEHEGLSYPKAIEELAKKYNETVEYDTTVDPVIYQEKMDRKDKLRGVLYATHGQYVKSLHELIKNNNSSHPAITEIFDKRQYSAEIIEDWGIGYAPSNFLYDMLMQSGRVSEGNDLGLIKDQWDKYSDRVIYPIYDDNDFIIGLAGRSLTNSKKAKWINPDVNSENLLYNKSKVWYGMNKARRHIYKTREAWVVEGYNDVIAWHINGLENTVAPCGTAITLQQVKELKRVADKAILCLDPDTAGIKAMKTAIPLFMRQGLRVEVLLLPCDPDDFSRIYSDSIAKYELPRMVKEENVTTDGFAFLMQHYLVGSDVEKANGAKALCEVISQIEDAAMIEIYTGWLQKESKIKAVSLKSWIKEFQEIANDDQNQYINIELPKDVKVPLSELREDILKYGMFMANNQIYMQIGNDRYDLHFTSKSNFMIEILQHMQDEKFPMKLLRIRNIHGEEKIFDTPSENLNSPQAFENVMTGQGNYNFQGNRADLNRLKTYLFDKMGVGRRIDVLGWQPDGGFWSWNNKITNVNGEEIKMDKHGIFVKENVHYYIPSANEIYKSNNFKFDAQKRFKVIDNKLSFRSFAMKVLKVHRDHGISALLFGIASLFQDIVVAKTDKFPIMFFYGPGSTGKDELAAIVQSFVGIPQTAINLEGQVSTIKAQVREFAQFRNGISQLSEYKRGNAQLDGMLKSLWDRRGYKRGNIESHVGTDSIPIESSAILTGNDYPVEEPLILRLIWNEMTKNQFTEKEMQDFDELKDLTAQGVSGYADNLIQYRELYEKEFDKKQRSWKAILREQFPEAKSRMIFNISILTATYDIFKDMELFPFTQNEMLDHFNKGFEQQLNKINSASVLVKFWQLFTASLRGHKDERIQVGHIVNVEGSQLFFNWTHVFSKVQRNWFAQFSEAAPGKSHLLEQIEESGAYVESRKSYSYDSGRDANRTSAIVINLDMLPEITAGDIVGSIVFQRNQVDKEIGQAGLFDTQPPATPEKNLKNNEEERPNTPF